MPGGRESGEGRAPSTTPSKAAPSRPSLETTHQSGPGRNPVRSPTVSKDSYRPSIPRPGRPTATYPLRRAGETQRRPAQKAMSTEASRIRRAQKKPVCPDFPRKPPLPWLPEVLRTDRPGSNVFLKKPVDPNYSRRATSPMATWIHSDRPAQLGRPSSRQMRRDRGVERASGGVVRGNPLAPWRLERSIEIDRTVAGGVVRDVGLRRKT